jgi:hypothetical protein
MRYLLVLLGAAPWASWLEFRYAIVRKMNLTLQPSFTESYNNVTADAIAEGVPVVVGPAIDWVPKNWIAPADEAVTIAGVGLSLLKDKNAARDGYRALVAYNNNALKLWKIFLSSTS